MLPCYAISEQLLAADKEQEVADVYVCTRDKYESLLEKYKDRFKGDAEQVKELVEILSKQLLAEAKTRAASDRFKASAQTSSKLLAINLDDGKGASIGASKGASKKSGKGSGKGSGKSGYLWVLESLDDLWAWAELPARLLEVAEQKIFRLVEPREQKARAKAILAWGLATYAFEKFRSNQSSSPLRLLLDDADDRDLRAQAKCAEIICDGRSLINTPANILGPQRLEQVVREIAEDSGGVMKVVRGEELLQQNYPLIYAVGKSAREAPRLLDVRWQAATSEGASNSTTSEGASNSTTSEGASSSTTSEGASSSTTSKRKSLTIVGKGVCFDSGGLNLKGASGMLLMKKDMAGAAHAICLARMLLASACPIDLRLLLPIAENAVSRDAMRPLDIYPSRKGDNVEIGHTDAEGRLLLADALWEASSPQRNKQGEKIASDSSTENLVPTNLVPTNLAPTNLVPDLIIDFATLTGAARVATGPRIPNLFTNSDALAESAARAARETQDPLWRMPLWLEYRSNLYSRCADISSASSWGYAGAITAALFLQNFVAGDISWIHVDLMAWNEKTKPGRPEGGEIQSARALADIVEKWSRE